MMSQPRFTKNYNTHIAQYVTDKRQPLVSVNRLLTK